MRISYRADSYGPDEPEPVGVGAGLVGGAGGELLADADGDGGRLWTGDGLGACDAGAVRLAGCAVG